MTKVIFGVFLTVRGFQQSSFRSHYQVVLDAFSSNQITRVKTVHRYLYFLVDLHYIYCTQFYQPLANFYSQCLQIQELTVFELDSKLPNGIYFFLYPRD